jgi:hypothetical protein
MADILDFPITEDPDAPIPPWTEAEFVEMLGANWSDAERSKTVTLGDLIDATHELLRNTQSWSAGADLGARAAVVTILRWVRANEPDTGPLTDENVEWDIRYGDLGEIH